MKIEEILEVILVVYLFGIFVGTWGRSFWADGQKITACVVVGLASLFFGSIIIVGFYKEGYIPW